MNIDQFITIDLNEQKINDREKTIILYRIYYRLFSDKQQLYFKLKFIEDLSLSEISENLGISKTAVSSSINKIILKLKNYEEKLMLYETFNNLYNIYQQLIKQNKIKDLEYFKKILEHYLPDYSW